MFPSFNARAVGLQLDGGATLELAAGVGFAGVDLMIRDIVEAGESLAELGRRMKRLGLKPGAFPLPMNWRGDREGFDRDLERLPIYAEAAAELGLVRTGTWVLPETLDKEAGAVERTVAFHHERLRPIAELLGRFGIRLGLEAIGVASFPKGDGFPFINRMARIDEALGPLSDVGPNVGVLADVFHLHAAGEPFETLARRSGHEIVWAHLADLPGNSTPDLARIDDADRGLPGENGAVDCFGFLETLERTGYDGPVTIEPMPRCRSLASSSAGAKAEALLKSIHRVWPTNLR